MLVSTKARFLEEDYMVDNKPKSKVVLDELRDQGIVSTVPGAQVDLSRVASTQEQGEPLRSGRVIRQLDRFISLEEVLKNSETDPCNYDEAI